MKDICPICCAQTLLVSHHDHFADQCRRLLEQANISEWRDNLFYTFSPINICPKCNSICAVTKKKYPTLPRWVSFSPFEIRSILNGTDVLALWKIKKETYRPKLQELLNRGVEREAIEKMWLNRAKQSPPTNTNAYRKTMLKALATLPLIAQQLCEAVENETLLADYIYKANWPRTSINSFIYWYHKKHNDPNCRNNQFGIGTLAFTEWFMLLATGELDAANERLRVALPYKRST